MFACRYIIIIAYKSKYLALGVALVGIKYVTEGVPTPYVMHPTARLDGYWIRHIAFNNECWTYLNVNDNDDDDIKY